MAARYLLTSEKNGVALSPLLLAALRFSIASLFFLFPLWRALKQRHVTLRALLVMALLGQLAFSLYYWLQYIGIQETDASISAVLGIGLIPIFTALLARITGKERWGWLFLMCLILGFLGVALVGFQKPPALHPGFFLGVLCLVVNTFLFALYTHLSKQWMQEDIPPVVMTAGTMISGAIGLLFLSLLHPSDWRVIIYLSKVQWAAILFLAVGCSALAYFAYNAALSQMDASRVTIYFYFEPVISIVLAIVLLGEQLTWQTVVGAVAISGAVIVAHAIGRQMHSNR
ncbi:hypothetical protein EPA93_10220 [Ktedonosporobacter rubrisoli]|uniref:EamA domain-containing protein n=1 Tax=Ktedonosporobacter rubrisoli TaxID=2509675 RepID=A0A4P6JMJ8_KTERU|nr:hypothetical protein EPA93_10220 [Ktedonosporobacter rubrisoli]